MQDCKVNSIILLLKNCITTFKITFIFDWCKKKIAVVDPMLLWMLPKLDHQCQISEIMTKVHGYNLNLIFSLQEKQAGRVWDLIEI